MESLLFQLQEALDGSDNVAVNKCWANAICEYSRNQSSNMELEEFLEARQAQSLCLAATLLEVDEVTPGEAHDIFNCIYTIPVDFGRDASKDRRNEAFLRSKRRIRLLERDNKKADRGLAKELCEAWIFTMVACMRKRGELEYLDLSTSWSAN